MPIVNHLIAWHEAIQDTKQDPYKWLKENPVPSPEPELGPGPEGQPPGAEGLPAGEGAAPPQVPAPSPSQILALAQGRSQ